MPDSDDTTWARVPPLYRWCFTLSYDLSTDKDAIILWLRANAKKWVFQKERGANGFIHWQGAFALNEKQRLEPLLLSFEIAGFYGIHLSRMSIVGAAGAFSCCTKSDTRVEGPWKDDDPEIFIPLEVQQIGDNLWPWQKSLMRHRTITAGGVLANRSTPKLTQTHT
jgi:hypothetical protein